LEEKLWHMVQVYLYFWPELQMALLTSSGVRILDFARICSVGAILTTCKVEE
jgi:hypothetical protein